MLISRLVHHALVVGLFAISSSSALFAESTSAIRQHALGTLLPEVSFEEQPLERVVDWLRDASNTNVIVRWQTLEDYGIDRETPISLRVRNLRLDQVLSLILEQAAGSDLRLGYLASDQMLTITTADDLDRNTITKVYDISDLLVRTPRFADATSIDPSQALSGLASGGGSGGGAGTGGGGTIFTPAAGGEREQVEEGGAAEEIADLIRNTIAPDSWRENGAGSGSIRVWRNLLIVHASIRVHQMIGGPVEE
ncbi:MAG: hypothetical protein AB7N71_01545 [Phycisphaerae bacterium]